MIFVRALNLDFSIEWNTGEMVVQRVFINSGHYIVV